jgi:hypothetical protein
VVLEASCSGFWLRAPNAFPSSLQRKIKPSL